MSYEGYHLSDRVSRARSFKGRFKARHRGGVPSSRPTTPRSFARLPYPRVALEDKTLRSGHQGSAKHGTRTGHRIQVLKTAPLCSLGGCNQDSFS